MKLVVKAEHGKPQLSSHLLLDITAAATAFTAAACTLGTAGAGGAAGGSGALDASVSNYNLTIIIHHLSTCAAFRSPGLSASEVDAQCGYTEQEQQHQLHPEFKHICTILWLESLTPNL